MSARPSRTKSSPGGAKKAGVPGSPARGTTKRRRGRAKRRKAGKPKGARGAEPAPNDDTGYDAAVESGGAPEVPARAAPAAPPGGTASGARLVAVKPSATTPPAPAAPAAASPGGSGAAGGAEQHDGPGVAPPDGVGVLQSAPAEAAAAGAAVAALAESFAAIRAATDVQHHLERALDSVREALLSAAHLVDSVGRARGHAALLHGSSSAEGAASIGPAGEALITLAGRSAESAAAADAAAAGVLPEASLERVVALLQGQHAAAGAARAAAQATCASAAAAASVYPAERVPASLAGALPYTADAAAALLTPEVRAALASTNSSLAAALEASPARAPQPLAPPPPP